MDFTWFDSRTILSLKGWNYQAHRDLPGKFESTNLSRRNVRREIGRSTGGATTRVAASGTAMRHILYVYIYI